MCRNWWLISPPALGLQYACPCKPIRDDIEYAMLSKALFGAYQGPSPPQGVRMVVDSRREHMLLCARHAAQSASMQGHSDDGLVHDALCPQQIIGP
jgi:hypothetical protein